MERGSHSILFQRPWLLEGVQRREAFPAIVNLIVVYHGIVNFVTVYRAIVDFIAVDCGIAGFTN